MSRGGFRGRGRGRGGFGGFGGPPIDIRGPAKHTGLLYPPLEPGKAASLKPPSEREEAILEMTLEMETILEKGLPGLVADGFDGAPWRLPEARKVVGIEIESWSDRKRPAPIAGPSKLDPVVLKMDQEFFPPSLWDEYFEQAKPAVPGIASKAKRKRKRVIDSDDEGPNASEGEKSVGSPSEDEFDFDDDDDEDHQDYDANYFDNGEGEDDESGGGDDEGGFGND